MSEALVRRRTALLVLTLPLALSAEPAFAQDGVEAAQDSPGWLSLFTATIMLSGWATAFGIAIHRARAKAKGAARESSDRND